MISFALSFALGNFFLQQFSLLPSVMGLIILLIMSVLLLFIAMANRYFCLLAFFSLGFCVSGLFSHHVLSWTLPMSLVNKVVNIQGIISSDIEVGNYSKNYLVKLLAINHITIKAKPIIKILIPSDVQFMRLSIGDEINLSVRLKKIHGLENTGTDDEEQMALIKHIRAIGIMKIGCGLQFIKHHQFYKITDQMRIAFKNDLMQELIHFKMVSWLLALLVGIHEQMSLDDWQILRSTGTNHLLAIAGLHLGFLAAFIIWCVKKILPLPPRLFLYVPKNKIAYIISFIFVFSYSALSGFSLPTERAFIMMFLWLIIYLRHKNIHLGDVWAITLIMTLTLDPLAILGMSFWLSFGTIAIILFTLSGRFYHGWYSHIKIQLMISLGLIPFSLVLFKECSLISIAANLIAIPALGFLILPFTLLGGATFYCWHSLSHFFFMIANQAGSILWMMLSSLAHLPFSTWYHVILNYFILFFLALSFMLLLSPFSFKLKWFAIIFLLPLFLYHEKKYAFGEMKLTLLDVGQGLSVVVRTKSHVLIYDTGAKVGESIGMGERVLMPYLNANDIGFIDKLIISHSDNDHSGGMKALLKHYPKTSVLTSAPQKLGLDQSTLCLRGQHWEWDGVKFNMIYPDKNHLYLNNNSSCVLVIDNGYHRILLTGDIEKRAEKYLVKLKNDLSAFILIAPHHGSQTSADIHFLKAVHPEFVLFATGYLNRYHFPHQKVIQLYESLHAKTLATHLHGQIDFFIKPEVNILLPFLYRIKHHRYWFSD